MTVTAQAELEAEPKNPERRGLRKGVYLIPSVFTAANIGMGFYAVMAAARGFQVLGNGSDGDLVRAAFYLDNAAKAIGWAVLFDMLDGRLARMTKTTTEIGVQLDSIADVDVWSRARRPGVCVGLRRNFERGKRSSQPGLVPVVHVLNVRGISTGSL